MSGSKAHTDRQRGFLELLKRASQTANQPAPLPMHIFQWNASMERLKKIAKLKKDKKASDVRSLLIEECVPSKIC